LKNDLIFEFQFSQSFNQFINSMKYEYSCLLFDTEYSNFNLFNIINKNFNILFNDRSEALNFIYNENEKQKLFFTGQKINFINDVVKIEEKPCITKNNINLTTKHVIETELPFLQDTPFLYSHLPKLVDYYNPSINYETFIDFLINYICKLYECNKNNKTFIKNIKTKEFESKDDIINIETIFTKQEIKQRNLKNLYEEDYLTTNIENNSIKENFDKTIKDKEIKKVQKIKPENKGEKKKKKDLKIEKKKI